MNVTIVGAGIHGLTLAWALVRAEHGVTLIDRGDIPNPANASFDQHRLIHDHAGVVSDAFAAWAMLERDIGRHYVQTGALRVYADAEQAARARQDLVAAWVACAPLDADGLRRVVPGLRLTAEHGVLTTRGGVLLADRIAAALAAWLTMHCVMPHAQTRVTEIDVSRAIVALDGGGTLHADRLVIAAGADTARLVPELVHRIGARRQIVAYLRPPSDRRDAWSRAPVFAGLGSDEEHWGAPPVAGTDLKLAAGCLARVAGRCEVNAGGVSAAERDALLACYRPVMPDIDSYDVLRATACKYATSAGDGGLFVEPLDADRRVWVIGGGDGGDYKRAPAVALALAARLMSA